MAYAPRSTHYDRDGTILGCFTEQEFGKFFEFSRNPEMTLSPKATGGRNVEFPHLVWVTEPKPGIDCGYRRALVGKTVVHMIVDEREDGSWTVEKWKIRSYREYNGA
jgi:hypothetical protein